MHKCYSVRIRLCLHIARPHTRLIQAGHHRTCQSLAAPHAMGVLLGGALLPRVPFILPLLHLLRRCHLPYISDAEAFENSTTIAGCAVL
jgi:hypothetical protein